MALLAYNLTGSPLALAAGVGPATLPASSSPPDRSEGMNVTSELRGLSDPDYALLQVQVAAGDIELQWTDAVDYETDTLFVTGGTAESKFIDSRGDVGITQIIFRPGAVDAVNGNIYNDYDAAFIASRTIVGGGNAPPDTFSSTPNFKGGPLVELICDARDNNSEIDLPGGVYDYSNIILSFRDNADTINFGDVSTDHRALTYASSGRSSLTRVKVEAHSTLIVKGPGPVILTQPKFFLFHTFRMDAPQEVDIKCEQAGGRFLKFDTKDSGGFAVAPTYLYGANLLNSGLAGAPGANGEVIEITGQFAGGILPLPARAGMRIGKDTIYVDAAFSGVQINTTIFLQDDKDPEFPASEIQDQAGVPAGRMNVDPADALMWCKAEDLVSPRAGVWAWTDAGGDYSFGDEARNSAGDYFFCFNAHTPVAGGGGNEPGVGSGSGSNWSQTHVHYGRQIRFNPQLATDGLQLKSANHRQGYANEFINVSDSVSMLALRPAGEKIGGVAADFVIPPGFRCELMPDGNGFDLNYRTKLIAPPSRVQVLDAAGAVELSASGVDLQVDATEAFSLADGAYDGQEIMVYCTDAINTPLGTLTPAKALDFTSVLFDAVGLRILLKWSEVGDGWYIVTENGIAIT